MTRKLKPAPKPRALRVTRPADLAAVLAQRDAEAPVRDEERRQRATRVEHKRAVVEGALPVARLDVRAEVARVEADSARRAREQAAVEEHRAATTIYVAPVKPAPTPKTPPRPFVLRQN